MAGLKCPKGMIVRSSYTTKRGVHVRAACVPDKGAPGKTPASRKVLPVPKKGSLGKYGYHDIKHTGAESRRVALRAGVENEGYAPIIRRLNLLANYTKVSDPETYKIMRADMAWVQRTLRASYSLTAKRTSSKKSSKRSSKKLSSKKRSSKRSSKKRSSKRSSKKRASMHQGLKLSGAQLAVISKLGKKACEQMKDRLANIHPDNQILSGGDLGHMKAIQKKMCDKLDDRLKELKRKSSKRASMKRGRRASKKKAHGW